MQIYEIKSLFSRFGIKPNKMLGQNFLLSEEVLDKIVEAAELSSEDTVLEIGPGLGFLTKRLAERAGEVIAVEKDRKLCQVLRKIFRNRRNVKIICGDALREIPVILNLIQDPDSRFRLGGRNDKEFDYKVVANIPYYLTGKILQLLLSPTPLPSSPLIRREGSLPSPDEGRVPRAAVEGREGFAKPSLIVLLLQKEVAERIVAKPGNMSILSVSVQFYADPEIIAHVPKENFYPVPEVDSAIIRISPHPPSAPSPSGRGIKGEGIDEGKFFQLLKIGFSNKRKQLHNNLRAGFTPLLSSPLKRREGELGTSPSPAEGRVAEGREGLDYKHLLSSLGLNPLCRAQDLSLEDWERLYQKIFPSLDGRG